MQNTYTTSTSHYRTNFKIYVIKIIKKEKRKKQGKGKTEKRRKKSNEKL